MGKWERKWRFIIRGEREEGGSGGGWEGPLTGGEDE